MNIQDLFQQRTLFDSQADDDTVEIVFGKNNLRVVWSQAGMEKTKNTVRSKEP